MSIEKWYDQGKKRTSMNNVDKTSHLCFLLCEEQNICRIQVKLFKHPKVQKGIITTT